MVFCYKIITDTPRASAAASPRRLSPTRRVPHSVSQLVRSIDYEASSGTIDSIPEREWRLLAALAKKREEVDERERLAEEFRKMWLREKEERDMVEAETEDQYKRYIQHKRNIDRSNHERLRLQRSLEQQMRRGEIISTIKHKERKAADVLAWIDDRKTTKMVDQALEEHARALLAADRRCRFGFATECRNRDELLYGQLKVDDARRKRSAFLKDASQRVAIANALSSWESALVRQEASVLEATRRAAHAARAARGAARAERLARDKRTRVASARRIAALTQRLRDIVRGGV